MARRLSLCVIAVLAAAALARALNQPASAFQSVQAVMSGSVVNVSLQPVVGAEVSLSLAGRTVARTRTGADGTFRFAQLPPGNYRVSVTAAGFQSTSRDVTIKGLELVQVPFALAPIGASDERIDSSDQSRSLLYLGQPSPSPVASPAMPQSVAQTQAVPPGRAGSAANFQPMFLSALESYPQPGSETYSRFESNRFQRTLDAPLSTFSADVDTASYANVRRFLQSGQLPPVDAVRVEELVNYFRLSYSDARQSGPIAVTTEVGDAPWAPAHKLVLVGVEGRAPTRRDVEGRNIVLLIDVSGSMQPANRLPLLKTAFAMFVDTLRADDRLAIVTYAGASAVALPSTPARERDRILAAIRDLGAGGSTNGAQGLVTAYRIARQSFTSGGVNRVILATDGDFNVGVVGDRSLRELIEQERRSGVFLSVLGVGEGNLKDRTMEMLADQGNGHYAYIDTLAEARRVLVKEGEATLETVAKDVKFQVEFNPATVSAWKLIGYENRALAAEDFNDDRKDAGDLGSGHSVTVLYEVIPVGVRVDDSVRPAIDPLRYQPAPPPEPRGALSGRADELATVKIRYKRPASDDSQLVEQVIRTSGRAINLPFAAAVAQYGLLLRTERASATEWDKLVARLRAITPPAGAAEDFAGFRDLTELARGIVRTRGAEER